MRAQLLAYGFGPDARFEGQLLGALERAESGGALRVLDVLVVLRDSNGGEPAVMRRRGDGAGGVVRALLDFRMDPQERRRATRKALAADDRLAGVVQGVSAALEPGGALMAAVVQHRWADALDDAVARVNGRPLAYRWVPTGDVVDAADLLTAAGQVDASPVSDG